MEAVKENLSSEERKKIEGLVDEMFGLLKDTKTGEVNIKELKAFLYYSNLHTKNPLGYKAISDREEEGKPELGLTEKEFKDLIMGNNFSNEKEPSLEEICLVLILLTLAL